MTVVHDYHDQRYFSCDILNVFCRACDSGQQSILPHTRFIFLPLWTVTTLFTQMMRLKSAFGIISNATL